MKQLLSYYPVAFMQGLLVYGSILSIAYYLCWVRYKDKLKNFRIQLISRVNSKQIRSEIKHALISLAGTSFFGAVIIYCSLNGINRVYTDLYQHSIWLAAGTFFFMWIVDDTWFYWCHRLLHHRSVYRYVHRIHHESIDVDPFTSLSFHIVEAALLPLWVLPVSFIIPMYLPAVAVFQMWGMLNNLKAHLGYEFFPSWTERSILRHLISSTHHNMHHSRFNGNYGLHFRFWDRLCGTEFKDYEASFKEIQQRKSGG